jgi:hypothetical protein
MAAASRVRNDSVAASSSASNELVKNCDSAKSTIKKPMEERIPVLIYNINCITAVFIN